MNDVTFARQMITFSSDIILSCLKNTKNVNAKVLTVLSLLNRATSLA